MKNDPMPKNSPSGKAPDKDLSQITPRKRATEQDPRFPTGWYFEPQSAERKQ